METTTSIVFGRNDGWKDDKRCIMHFLSSLETFDEIIYIDWNSDPKKGSLFWKLKPFLPKTGKIKHFIIEPDIVKILCPNSDTFSVLDVPTRNIGIRRSKGDWIVNTTMDIIPPSREDLQKFITTGNKNTFYTVSRREAPIQIFEKYQYDNWKNMREELIQTIGPRYFYAKVSPNDNYSIINCCGDFQIAHKDIWIKIKGYEEKMDKFCFIDTNIQKKAVLNGYKLEAIYDLPLFHIEHDQYIINENNEKEKISENSKSNYNKYNDVTEWVELFYDSQNLEDWGLNKTDIEYEIY